MWCLLTRNHDSEQELYLHFIHLTQAFTKDFFERAGSGLKQLGFEPVTFQAEAKCPPPWGKHTSPQGSTT